MYISIGFLLITLHMTSIIIVRGPPRTLGIRIDSPIIELIENRFRID